MKNLILLLALLLPGVSYAQEIQPVRNAQEAAEWERRLLEAAKREAMVLVNGVLQVPTPEIALRQLKLPGPHKSPNAARAVLRQVFEPRSPAELDAFANELGRIFRDGAEPESANALAALLGSTTEEDARGGTRYAGAIDVLICVAASFEDPKHPRAIEADIAAALALRPTHGDPSSPPGIVIKMRARKC